MNIRQDCLITLLKDNNFDWLYLDNYYPGTNIYFYGGSGNVTLTLTESCIPFGVALNHLENFPLKNWINKLNQIDEDCQCY